MITQLLKYPVTPEATYARIGQAFCFLAACILPVLVLRKFVDLEISEAQLLLGVVATMSMALLCAVIGFLLGLPRKAA